MESNFLKTKELIINEPLIQTTSSSITDNRAFLEKIETFLKDLNLNKRVIKKCIFVTAEFFNSKTWFNQNNKELNIRIKNTSDKLLILYERYYLPTEIQALIEKIDAINCLSKMELTKRLKTILHIKMTTPTEPEFGLIELKRKSDGNILYNYTNIDDKKSLFSIIVIISC